MEVGSLVKYVGSAAMYRDRIGVIAQTVKFSNTSSVFAVIIKENKGNVALLFHDGEVKWFNKNKVVVVNS